MPRTAARCHGPFACREDHARQCQTHSSAQAPHAAAAGAAGGGRYEHEQVSHFHARHTHEHLQPAPQQSAPLRDRGHHAAPGSVTTQLSTRQTTSIDRARCHRGKWTRWDSRVTNHGSRARECGRDATETHTPSNEVAQCGRGATETHWPPIAYLASPFTPAPRQTCWQAPGADATYMLHRTRQRPAT